MRRYVRFEHDGAGRWGLLEAGEVRPLEDSPFGGHEPAPAAGRAALPLASVRLLAPCEPGKVIGVGRNYASHLGDRHAPAEPGLFAKLPTSVVGPGAPIPLPSDATEVHCEGEVVVVIGRRTRHVRPSDVAAHVLGVTAGNDVSERVWQRADLQWLRAKACDGFAPLGPAIVSGLDYRDLGLETRIGGEVVQSGRTRELLFGVDEVVSYLSRYVTLLPGDAVFTGTPGVTRAVRPGDVVEVEVEGVGVLANPVTGAGRGDHAGADDRRGGSLPDDLS